MANEAQVQFSLAIRAGNINETKTMSFRADVAGRKGPAPGAFTVSTSGTDVDLSAFVTPGLAVIGNLDETNYVDVGIYDPESSLFYPFQRLLPGEGYPLRLSPDLGGEYTLPGTATGPETNRLRFRANGAPCVCVVLAYEA